MWRPCATDEGRPSKYSDTIRYDDLMIITRERRNSAVDATKTEDEEKLPPSHTAALLFSGTTSAGPWARTHLGHV